MKLVVWNSQGAKWDAFWTNWIAPIAPGTGANTDDVTGMLVESGWAPWVLSGNVVENGLYLMDPTKTGYFDTTSANNSAFCQGVDSVRAFKAAWVPWVKNLNAMKTNSRCSLGSAVLPSTLRFMGYNSSDKGLLRPVITTAFARGNAQVFTVLTVHLVSSYNAINELDWLTAQLSTLIPEKTPALVVGDMNVNLLTTPYAPKDNRWHVLSTGGATQQSGGELDWALLYDPSGQYYQGATAQVLQQYKSGNNQSDHSVMMYTLNV